ncbi:MAG: metallophosphoesterase [Deltaproteobacteria bacterium]|nr:MAG: metallophosphoesterase [Deltaproteobacteria bacterium]
MSTFLLIYFLVYCGLHLYSFVKARRALRFGRRAGASIAGFMVLMVLAPIFVRLSESAGFEALARIMAYGGYTWMGLIFLFFSASLALDTYRLLVFAAGVLLRKDLSRLSPSARYSFFISLLFTLIAAGLGYFSARDIHTERVVIKTPKLSAEVGKLRIVQISDLHLGLIVREERLRLILDKVEKAEPDILVSTGDLWDSQMCNFKGLSELLGRIKPRYGKYAVTGNHEYYTGLERSLEFTRHAGFTVLRGEAVVTGGMVNIAGVDDRSERYPDLSHEIPVKELLSGLDRSKFTILLKHRPEIDTDALGLFDLQLSGHTHKGQIFPFMLITRMYYKITSGYLKLNDNSSLYISRGSGTWGPPIRFLAPPEVTVIELVHKEGE